MAYQVNITHFINPHLFYFCKINTSNYLKIKSQIELIEQEINCKVNKGQHPITKVGDEVAVYFLTWRRFIRARVDYIVKLKDRYEYTVWALDYGFPFQTKIDFMYNLPREFAGAPSHIKRGGLHDIMPGENIFYMGESKVRPTDNWHEKACTSIEDILRDCFSVHFEEDFKQDEHYWGELIVTNNLDERIVLSALLKEKNYALAAFKIFRSRCAILPTIQIQPWLNNSRNYTCKHNEVNTSLLTKETPKQQAQLNADLTEDHIRKVNDWRCFNDSSDKEENDIEEEIEETVCTHLGMSVITKNAVSRETALEKFLCEKEENLADNLQIYEAYKDILPQEAVLALNPKLSFENQLETSDMAASVQDLSDQQAFIDSLRKRGSLRKQGQKNEELSSDSKTVSPNVHTKRYKDLFKEAHLKLIPAGMEVKSVKLEHDLPSNSSVKSYKKNLIDFSSTSESGHSFNVSSKSTQSDSSQSQNYEPIKNNTKESSSVNSSSKLLANTTSSGSLTDDEQILNESKDQDKQDSCLDALLRFTVKNKEKPKIKQKLAIANAGQEEILNFGDERNLKIVEQMVLAHSRAYLKSVKKLENSYLIKSIFERMMHMKIDKIYRVQAYAWAHVMLKNSVFIVGASKTGKTWAYMPQICSLVAANLMQTELHERKKSAGPVAVILAASAQHVEYVANISEQLLSDVKQHINLNIVRSYGIFDTQRVKMELLNGCGMLITTVPSLQRLIADEAEMQALLNARRLRHIVVDDMDLLKSRNQAETEEVLKKLLCLTQKHKPQLIVTTRHWEKLLGSLLKFSLEPVLLFGDFLEAAVYGHVDLRIKLCTPAYKFEAIKQFLQKLENEDQRTIIFCNTEQEVDDVVAQMQLMKQECLVYDNRSNIEFANIPSKWQKGLISGVLVCMDTAFCDAEIKNAHNLIHFSMPDTWTKFTKRFASIANNHENILLSEAHNSKESCKTHALILLDAENNEQLPRLFEFLQQHKQHELIHPDMLAVCEHVKQTREANKLLNKVALCNYLLEFGNCEEPHCTLRHQLASYDADKDLPTSGQLQIHILKVHSVTHYSARLLRHKALGAGTWQNVRSSNEYTAFNMKLNMFYGQAKNKAPFWPLTVNAVCIYCHANNYQRAAITQVPVLKHPDVISNVWVSLHLIDVGITLTDVASNNLLVCDEQFKHFPAQAVNIRLQHIIPFDNERSWDAFTTHEVQKRLSDTLTKQQVVQVNINGAFAHTIWTKNVFVMEMLTTIKQQVCHFNLKAELLEKKYALLKNYQTSIDVMLEKVMEEHLKILPQVEQQVEKVDVKHIESEAKTTSSFVEKWIELPLNAVYVLELGNESNNGHWHTILAQICNAEQQQIFANLCNLIDEQVEKQKEKPQAETLDLTWFIKGRNCLIKYDAKHYYRAKIVDVLPSKVRFFLCDFAAFVTKELNMELYADFLYETTQQIIEFTPYQAVHCTLAGIELRDLVTEHYFVTKEYLHALAVQTRKKTDLSDVFGFLNINSYEILLYESDDKVATADADMLNKTLVDNGFATLMDEELLQLKIEDFIKQEEEEEEAAEPAVATEEDDVDDSEDENYYDKMLEITSLIEKLQMQNENHKQEEHVKKTPQQITTAEDNDNNNNNNNKNNTKLASTSSNVIINVLKPLHKHAKVVWYQDDYFIYIIIHAPDVKDYYLKINENTVFYCAEINDEREMCILNLLDTIQTDHLWYDLVGLSLRIRLLKTQFIMWPRLLQQRDKFSWLKYDLDKVKTSENISLMRGFYLVSGFEPEDLRRNDDDDSDGSESEALCFEDIAAHNYIDDADPFGEV